MSDPLPLAEGFPPASKDDWLEQVRRVLFRGAGEPTEEEFAQRFARRLVTTTDDGIEIQPLYTREDQPQGEVLPGQAPFIRSTHSSARAWEIRQRVWPEVVGSTAVGELESGATGVLIQMQSDTDLARALDGVLLDLAPVSLSGASIAQARGLLEAWAAAGVSADQRHGCLGLDPLGAWARTGGAGDLEREIDDLAKLVAAAVATAPQARVVLVDGTLWHDAGATPGQELAWTIAAGMWIVRQLVARGVPLPTAVATVEFRFAATTDQFGTIAKLRAARWLWARALQAAGLGDEDQRMRMQVETSRVMLTRYDIWVNILRSTVATFSAAVGGADSITVLPHDLLIEPGGSELGRRIARNTQSILMLESHLAQVVDPAGGSWYVETLTQQTAQAAWSLVHDSERAGGIEQMLVTGEIDRLLAPVLAAREHEVDTRRRSITGVNEYPNIDESAPPQAKPEPVHDGGRFPALTVHRWAEGFEEQRARAEAMAVPPLVYLATIGTAADSTARATYAKNFFEAAGIRTVTGPVDEYVGAAQTPVVCLCSSDDMYAGRGDAAVEALRTGGATRVYQAGMGAPVANVDEQIGIGVDVLDSLTRLLDEWEATA